MNLSTPLISVVVPIYKVEKYLKECIDSIINQTLKEIEIILVDDGSPDGCPAIVDEYAAKDSRIVAIHQPNGGYGKAVNKGITAARAPYIGIIESDDWIEPTMYEKLYKRAIETDAQLTKCLFWCYNSFQPKAKRDIIWFAHFADYRKAPDGVFKADDWEVIYALHPCIWTGLYKAELIRQVPFIESNGASFQDFPFMFEILAKAETISIVKEPLVHYRVEPQQGSSCTGTGKSLLKMLDMTIKVQEIIHKYNLLKKHKEICYYRIFTANNWRIERISPEFKREFFVRFSKLMKDIIQDSQFQWKYFNKKEKRAAQLIGASSPYEHYCVSQMLEQEIEHLKNKVSSYELLVQYPTLLRKYRILKLKSLLTWGKRKSRYKDKINKIKPLVRKSRAAIRKQANNF